MSFEIGEWKKIFLWRDKMPKTLKPSLSLRFSPLSKVKTMKFVRLKRNKFQPPRWQFPSFTRFPAPSTLIFHVFLIRIFKSWKNWIVYGYPYVKSDLCVGDGVWENGRAKKREWVTRHARIISGVILILRWRLFKLWYSFDEVPWLDATFQYIFSKQT